MRLEAGLDGVIEDRSEDSDHDDRDDRCISMLQLEAVLIEVITSY